MIETEAFSIADGYRCLQRRAEVGWVSRGFGPVAGGGCRWRESRSVKAATTGLLLLLCVVRTVRVARVMAAVVLLLVLSVLLLLLPRRRAERQEGKRP